MGDLILEGALASITPSTHPGLARGRFVFCDDQPNRNNQGIEYEDFPEIKATLIGSPVKMRFSKGKEDNHAGSIPIGHIDGFIEEEENGVHTLIADCVLYAEEFPEEIQYLRTAFAEDKAPGLSYEVRYRNSIIKDGIEWVKNLAVRAATFVRNPAYGNRTRLLALASNQNISPEDFMQELIAMANEENSDNTEKGGNKRMTDQEIQKLQDDLRTAQTALAEKVTELTEKDGVIQGLTTEKETLTSSLKEKDTKIAEFETKEVLASRKASLVDAGITLEIKPERLTSMDNESFAAYVEDLKAVAATKKPAKLALASDKGTAVPRFTPTEISVSGSDLLTKFKNMSRSHANAADTE